MIVVRAHTCIRFECPYHDPGTHLERHEGSGGHVGRAAERMIDHQLATHPGRMREMGARVSVQTVLDHMLGPDDDDRDLTVGLPYVYLGEYPWRDLKRILETP